MLKVYQDATETNYAYYTAVKLILMSFVMLVILPRSFIYRDAQILNFLKILAKIKCSKL
jgi:hypothetical protein